jgi:hypothetical protein
MLKYLEKFIKIFFNIIINHMVKYNHIITDFYHVSS